MKLTPKDAALAYPEESEPSARAPFFERIIELLAPATWVIVTFNPPPWDRTRERIERDCQGVLIRMDIPPRDVAWLCPKKDTMTALPGLFGALIPELYLIGFDFKPTLDDITSAIESDDAKPARIFLLFDEGVLWEMRNNDVV